MDVSTENMMQFVCRTCLSRQSSAAWPYPARSPIDREKGGLAVHQFRRNIRQPKRNIRQSMRNIDSCLSASVRRLESTKSPKQSVQTIALKCR
jgi:hypothetical protein